MFWITILTTVCLTVPAIAEGSGTEPGKVRHDQMQHEKTKDREKDSQSTKREATQSEQGNMNHNATDSRELIPGQAQATGVGVINAFDTDKKMINITHEPMLELGWPAMTMDLAVTKRVDLSRVKVGDKVKFNVKRGWDKQYRIIDIKAEE